MKDKKDSKNFMQRIQKVLSKAGVSSRRQAEKLILSGKVKVNNELAEIGDKVYVKKDKITVNDKLVKINDKFVYYIVNKPKGYICSNKKQGTQDKLVIDLVPNKFKVWAVGRLDKDSSGLVLLTNDGELTQKYTHPSFEHEKEYEVLVDKEINQKFLNQMQQGVKLEEGLVQADEIKKIADKKFKIILHQGWKRQIRRMCEKLDYEVKELERVRVGKIKLGNLKQGEYKVIFNLLI